MLIDNIQHIKTAVKFDRTVSSSPLGIYYEINFHKEKSKKLIDYWRQDTLAEILHKNRISFCMRSIVPGRVGVKLLHNKEFQKAHYGNLMVCGSIWICPVCASKISERRKQELKIGFANFKGGFIMVTYTLRHANNESLAKVLGRLDSAYKLLTGGRAWQEFKKKNKILGSVSNLEITFGDNGWHPHKHVVYLVKNEFVIKQFKIDLENMWLHNLSIAGGSGLSGVAVRADLVTDFKGRVAEYMAEHDKLPQKESWGIEAELTKSYVKSSKNFWSIVDDFISLPEDAGEKKYNDLCLIKEYAEATKGRRSVVMSRGLRKLLNLHDKSDLEIAKEEDKKAELLILLSREIWKKIKDNKRRGELLKVASNGNLEDVYLYLDNI